MKPALISFLGLILCHGAAVAQLEAPAPLPEEQRAVAEETKELCQSLMPVLATAAKSTVRIWVGDHRLAYGTVIGDGHKVLTKWSEIARAPARLSLTTAAGTELTAKVTGVYEDEDLAVLETSGPALTPVSWSKDIPKLGAFLAVPQPDGRLAAFGVVSVPERNLRDTDQAYLGVIGTMDFAGPGVKIQEVASESGAAAAGLRPGNIITKVGERQISGLLELKNALVGKAPGTTISVIAQTPNGEKQFSVLLGKRPPLPNYPGDRLRQMEHMGGPLSQVRDGFTRVMQSDMRPNPDQIGGPVVDLKGRVVGITMARADRTRSFIMPAEAVENLLRQPPHDPAVAQLRPRQQLPNRATGGLPRPGLPQPGDAERMRRHILDMQRLMDYMAEEMNGLQPPR